MIAIQKRAQQYFKIVGECVCAYFYLSLLGQIPKEVFSAASIAGTLTALFFSILALLNRTLAQRLALGWEGV